MKNLSIVFHPALFFAMIQTIPLVCWLFISDGYFNIFLQGYEKSEFGVISGALYFILILSFVFGSRLASAYSNYSNGDVHSISRHIGFIRWLHYCSLCLMTFSAVFVVIAILKKDVDLFDTLAMGNANTFKAILYSTSSTFQALLMGRHLVLTAFSSWLILYYYDKRPKTLPLIIIVAVILFLFSSSRLVVIGMLLIFFLFYLSGIRLRLSSMVMLLAMACGLVIVFGIGVWFRSAGTWFRVTGSENILVAIGAEFFGYFISPVNYSIALIQEGVSFYIDNMLQFTFSVVYSVLNLPVNSEHLLKIQRYYNPGLNQIGLLGQWYTGYGPFLFIPSFLFGFIAGLSYSQFLKRNLNGFLLYPIVLIALFDSFRGFLLFQNILAANLFFIVLVWIVYHSLKFAVIDLRSSNSS